MGRIAITYGEFYDFPRMIRFKFGEDWFLLRSFFDEETDDYSDVYEVYLLPFRSEDEFRANPDYWMPLDNAIHLGHIRVLDVGLDETRRRSIDSGKIESWLTSRRK